MQVEITEQTIDDINEQPVTPAKKKRGRKPKNNTILNEPIVTEPAVPKKRGRKPKGGKIVTTTNDANLNFFVNPNIVLHLKCSSKDLSSQTESYVAPNEEYFKEENQSHSGTLGVQPHIHPASTLGFEELEDSKHHIINEPECLDNIQEYYISKKSIHLKLKNLQKQLHSNDVSDKKSSCFWCTYEFDNPPIFIPKYKANNSYHVYGCFCTPECGVAHLMNENIDTSEKFERYHLLNYIYGAVYEYKNNIKPAPNPHYLLDKFYGSLSIHEYRTLLRNETLLMVIDKPLTRMLPELHEENTDFISTKNTISQTSAFQIKRKSTKPPQTKPSMFSNVTTK